MNHDDNKNTEHTLGFELEARVVAWISGEASAFEAAELERLITGKPELAIFKRRMQAVQGLVAEAVRPDKEPLRLSPERRAKLLQELDGKKPDALLLQNARLGSSIISLKAERYAQRKSRRWILVAAACVTLGLFAAMLVPSFQKVRRVERRQVSFALPDARYSENADYYAMPPTETTKRQLELKRKAEFVGEEKAREDSIARAEMRKPADFEDRRESEENSRERRLAALAQVADESPRRRAQRSGPAAPASVPAPVPAEVSTWSARSLPDSVSAGRRDKEDIAVTHYAGVNSGSDYKFKGAEVAGNITERDASKKTVLADSKDADSLALADVPSTNNSPAPTSVGGDVGYVAKQEAAGARADEAIVLDQFVVTKPKLKQTVDVAANEGAPSLNNNILGNAVAADTFGYISEANVGEFQKRLSGVASGAGKSAMQAVGQMTQDIKPAKPIPVNTDNKAAEVIAANDPVSTFSLHVSDVSFKIAKAALASGGDVDRERIRPEEFYNAFNYGDPSPALIEKISCHIEQAAHPFMQQRNLVRIAMKVAAAGRGAGQPLRLTVLLDTSGSMEREDRADAVRGAMQSLVSLLGPNDRVTLIGFARQPRLLAESVPGDQAGELLKILANTPAEGGTNLEEALKLGRELARRQFAETAQNRIVLLTDGAANLGNADREELAASIEESRQEGIAFDACGVGMEGLDDAMLETLSRKGDGRYYVLNSAEDADAGFARQLAGALRPAAKNVKLQVRFNPSRVRSYRLIGFEKHRLREEDFRNDKVDAAELAAEEAAVAVYQVEPLPQGEGELGEVFVRFLDPSTGNMVERSWTLPYEAKAPAFDRASPTMQLAGAAALLAETLQRGEKEDAARLDELMPVVKALPGHFPGNDRVDDLVTMFEQLKKLSAE